MRDSLPTPSNAPTLSRRRRRRGIRKAKPGCRRPLMVFDRVKVSALLLAVFFLLAFLKMADNPLIGFGDGVRMTFNSYGWLLTLVSAGTGYSGWRRWCGG